MIVAMMYMQQGCILNPLFQPIHRAKDRPANLCLPEIDN